MRRLREWSESRNIDAMESQSLRLGPAALWEAERRLGRSQSGRFLREDARSHPTQSERPEKLYAIGESGAESRRESSSKSGPILDERYENCPFRASGEMGQCGELEERT